LLFCHTIIIVIIRRVSCGFFSRESDRSNQSKAGDTDQDA